MLRVSRYDFVVVLNLLIEVIFLMNGGKSFHNEAPLNSHISQLPRSAFIAVHYSGLFCSIAITVNHTDVFFHISDTNEAKIMYF